MNLKMIAAYMFIVIGLALIIGFVYGFVTNVPPGALDCTITWGRTNC